MKKIRPSSHRKMDKRYWDGMAEGYEDEIFSVLHSDERGAIRRLLKLVGSKRRSVADVGCGIGHFLPLLSRHFGQVYANDISGELLARARTLYGHFSNIVFLAGDIRCAFKKLPRVDCAVSINSLISSSVSIRLMMLQAMADRLKPGGYLLLVVPAFESSVLVDVRYAEWLRKNGMPPARAERSVYRKDPSADNMARQGILLIDGVATKHFLKEELGVLLSEAGFDMVETSKIEYGWGTEFESPPRWMGGPYPWDWLIMAKRRKERQ